MTDELENLTGHALLRHKRVVAAFKGLCPEMWSEAWGHIHYSLAVVAFAMRDALVQKGVWLVEYGDFILDEVNVDGNDVDAWHWWAHCAKAEHWIIAAVLAWEEK